ncbi:MAG: hypothetical protein P4L51_15180 [Puia sp.]|nr:hypothetical protein [Puia sp.]
MHKTDLISQQQQPSFPAFKNFLFKDRSNKNIIGLSLIAIVIQFLIFKYFYPFASYIHGDSFVYLDTAYQNLSINSYMIGYSMFIRAFSVFSSSDVALVWFQYLLLQSSGLFFLFTLFYFYDQPKWVKSLLVCFLVLNPMFPYMANLISSDSLFASLSLIWFSLLLWIIHKPNNILIIWHTIIIFIAFTVRYNALIYLLIAGIAFVLSNQTFWKKIIGLSASILVIGLFVVHTGNEYKKLTGTWQYSPFAGWLWSNNAMYTYRYVDSLHRKPVLKRFQALDNMIRAYFDSTRDVKKFPLESAMASTFYMWSPGLPLYDYRDKLFKKDSISSDFKKWATMGPIYKDYGLYIIKQYPLYYLRYFLWPNANKYYAPPVEFLESYNSGKDSVAPIAAIWFHYNSYKVTTRTKDPKTKMLDFYPILSGMINMVMLFSLLSYTYLGGWKQNIPLRKGMFLGVSVWLLNAGFTIIASPAALRFQCFPIILTTVYTIILIGWILKLATEKEPIQRDDQFVLNKVLK